MHRKVLLYTAASVLGLTLACSKSIPDPASPSSAAQPETRSRSRWLHAQGAGSDHHVAHGRCAGPGSASTLIASTVTRSTARPRSSSYRFEVRSGSTVIVHRHGRGMGIRASVSSPAALEPGHQLHVARSGGAQARRPVVVRRQLPQPGRRVHPRQRDRDPLINRPHRRRSPSVPSSSSGTASSCSRTDSRVSYPAAADAAAGEFSVMVTGLRRRSPGDKTKIMSMQEGGGDITTTTTA